MLLEEAEVVGLIGLHLSEPGLLLPQHVCVVRTGLDNGEAHTHRRGGWYRLVLHWGVVCLHLLADQPTSSNGGPLLLLVEDRVS